jgi:hypothetical protein
VGLALRLGDEAAENNWEMGKMKLYKILENGKSCHGGSLEWDLPKKDGCKWISGKWHEVSGDLSMCQTGLHLTSKPFKWYTWHCECFLAEADGIAGELEDKIVCRKVRLIKPVQHPAWWIKAHEFVEKEIKAITWFQADGKPAKHWKLFEENTLYAAWAAAGDAAGDAARAAARDAAGNAAWAAAGDAARAAARDAAGNAAWAAAWAAAGAAAGAAARDAAGNAAWAAARAAALYAQFIICQDLKLPTKHIKHIKDRWRVWQKGYGLLCDINDVLYVYGIKRKS